MLQSITLQEVNATAASVLSFATHYGHEGELLDEAQLHPETFSGPGPTRATAVIACIPAFTDASGQSTGAHHRNRGDAWLYCTLQQLKHVAQDKRCTVINGQVSLRSWHFALCSRHVYRHAGHQQVHATPLHDHVPFCDDIACALLDVAAACVQWAAFQSIAAAACLPACMWIQPW